MTELEKLLKPIEERVDKATSGPWEKDIVSEVTSSDGDICWQMSMLNDGENAEFIAHARADVPALIKALRVAVTALSEIRSYSLGSKADICDEAQAKMLKILKGDGE